MAKKIFRGETCTRCPRCDKIPSKLLLNKLDCHCIACLLYDNNQQRTGQFYTLQNPLTLIANKHVSCVYVL